MLLSLTLAFVEYQFGGLFSRERAEQLAFVPATLSTASFSSSSKDQPETHLATAKRLLTDLRRNVQPHPSRIAGTTNAPMARISDQTKILIMGYIDRELEKMRQVNQIARQRIQTLESILNTAVRGNAKQQAKAMSDLRTFERIHIYSKSAVPAPTVSPLPLPDPIRPEQIQRFNDEIRRLANASSNALADFLFKHQRSGNSLGDLLHSLRRATDTNIGEKALVAKAQHVAKVYRMRIKSAVTSMIRQAVMRVFDNAMAKIETGAPKLIVESHKELID
jgi:hypothetical protein